MIKHGSPLFKNYNKNYSSNGTKCIENNKLKFLFGILSNQNIQLQLLQGYLSKQFFLQKYMTSTLDQQYKVVQESDIYLLNMPP